jgi:lysophospholipase L1-like esterase
MCRYFIFILLLAGSACSPIRNYQYQPEVLSWEEDIRQFEQLDRIETYPPNSILFVGSSSIRMWSALAQDMSPYPVIQRGYGGARLSDLAVYAERIIYPHQFRAIVMFIANDISGSEEDKSPREVVRLYKYVLKTIRKKYPDTPVFWIAITPTASRWSVWPQIIEVNKLVQGACVKDKNAHFITTDFAFLDASGLPREELFLPDKLHLNAGGYALWTQLIRKELDKVLQE